MLQRLESGDYALTRISPDGDVFLAIIDQDTGEFVDSCRPTLNLNTTP